MNVSNSRHQPKNGCCDGKMQIAVPPPNERLPHTSPYKGYDDSTDHNLGLLSNESTAC